MMTPHAFKQSLVSLLCRLSGHTNRQEAESLMTEWMKNPKFEVVWQDCKMTVDVKVTITSFQIEKTDVQGYDVSEVSAIQHPEALDTCHECLPSLLQSFPSESTHEP